MQWYIDDRIAKQDKRFGHTEDLTRALRDKVVCLTLIGKEQELAELESEIKAHHASAVETHLIENQYARGWHWLTVHDHRATKDQAINLLREMHQLETHALVAFGDQTNDLKMLRIADHPIAVANATAELKSHAKQVIGSNHDDSVVRFIQEHRKQQIDR